MLRLFAGLSIPDGIVARLRMLCSGIPGARWVDPENMHVTLRFIGEVEEAVAGDIHQALTSVDADVFSIEIGGLNTFGHGNKMHALWVGVEPAPELFHLQSKIESAVVRCGQPPEGRKFTPHLTLARLHRPDPVRVQSFIEGNNLFNAGPFSVERFSLYESRTGKGGPIYTALEDYPLQG